MSITLSLYEIVKKAEELGTREEKVEWLKKNNSQALRTILTVMYDADNFVWNIPSDSIPPYTPSVHHDSHGMLYRHSRKMRYFIKGYDGDTLPQYRREFLFIEMLETVDKDDASLLERTLLQQPSPDLPYDVVNEGLGTTIPPQKNDTKKGRKGKNV